MVQEMMQFDQNGAKYENFSRRVPSVLSRAVIYKGDNSSSGGKGRPGALLARRTEEGMETDDLLCSRNARPRRPSLDTRSGRSIKPPLPRERNG